MTDQSGSSGTPHRSHFTSETDTLTSPTDTLPQGTATAQTIQIVMPSSGGCHGQGSGLRISVSSGQGENTPSGGRIILNNLGGSHGTSVTFSTLPKRVAHIQRGISVPGNQEVRRVRRLHSCDEMTLPIGRVTVSSPQIEENVFHLTASDSPQLEANQVMFSAPISTDNVYHATEMSHHPQSGRNVFVHKIHLVPGLSRVDEHRVVVAKESAIPPLSSCGVAVTRESQSVGVAGPVHESVCHVPLSHSTSASDASVSTQSTARFYVVSPTDTKTHVSEQQAWRDTDSLLHFDDTIASNMRRFMTRGSDGVVTPPVTQSACTQQYPTIRKLPLVTITHRRKASGDQLCDVCTETPVTPDDKRNLFRKFNFRFGSIGDYAGSGGSSSDGSATSGSSSIGSATSGSSSIGSGSGGIRQTRSRKPDVFYFQDFDDLASRIRVLWRKRQEEPIQDCQYTCHHKCRPLITLDCEHCSPCDGTERISRNHSETSLMNKKSRVDDADSGYHTGNSTLQAVAAAARGAGFDDTAVSREELRGCIQAFNNNHHGLIMTLDPQSETFQGFIRVHLNLIRPINMSVSGHPPSFYEVLTQEEEAQQEEHITSFYLPKNTTKVVHISSETTTEQVIRALLAKYKITDNPRKFALYEKIETNENMRMQRLADDTCPLPLCLSWMADGLDTHMFVLQENDTGEIIWEAFSLPELENFLKILDREEAEYVEQVKAKYHLLKLQMMQRLKHLNKECSTDDKRQPVFV